MTNWHRPTEIVALSITMGAIFTACETPPDPRRTNFRVERENVVAHYDDKTGRLKRLEVDTDKDGRTDTWTVTEGTRIDRIEIDKDQDGTIDRWEYYGPNLVLEKVGTSSRGDGVVDEWAFQGPGGHLARVETDTDRDGKIDKWETFEPAPRPGGTPVLRTVGLDLEKTGRPTRLLFYKADGSFERVETLTQP